MVQGRDAGNIAFQLPTQNDCHAGSRFADESSHIGPGHGLAHPGTDRAWMLTSSSTSTAGEPSRVCEWVLDGDQAGTKTVIVPHSRRTPRRIPVAPR